MNPFRLAQKIVNILVRISSLPAGAEVTSSFESFIQGLLKDGNPEGKQYYEQFRKEPAEGLVKYKFLETLSEILAGFDQKKLQDLNQQLEQVESLLTSEDSTNATAEERREIIRYEVEELTHYGKGDNVGRDKIIHHHHTHKENLVASSFKFLAERLKRLRQSAGSFLSGRSQAFTAYYQGNKKRVLTYGGLGAFILTAIAVAMYFLLMSPFKRIDAQINRYINADAAKIDLLQIEVEDLLFAIDDKSKRKMAAGGLLRMAALKLNQGVFDRVDFAKVAGLSFGLYQGLEKPRWLNKVDPNLGVLLDSVANESTEVLPNTNGGAIVLAGETHLGNVLPQIREAFARTNVTAGIVGQGYEIPSVMEESWVIVRTIATATSSNYVAWTLDGREVKLRAHNPEVENLLNKPSPELIFPANRELGNNPAIIQYHESNVQFNRAFQLYQECQLAMARDLLNAGLNTRWEKNVFGPQILLLKGIIDLMRRDNRALRENALLMQRFQNVGINMEFTYCNLLYEIALSRFSLNPFEVEGESDSYLRDYIKSSGAFFYRRQRDLFRILSALIDYQNRSTGLSWQIFEAIAGSDDLPAVGNPLTGPEEEGEEDLVVNPQNNLEEAKEALLQTMRRHLQTLSEMEQYELALVFRSILVNESENAAEAKVQLDQVMADLELRPCMTTVVFPALFPQVINRFEEDFSKGYASKLANFFLNRSEDIFLNETNISMASSLEYISGLAKLAQIKYGSLDPIRPMMEKIGLGFSARFSDLQSFFASYSQEFIQMLMSFVLYGSIDPAMLDDLQEFWFAIENYMEILDEGSRTRQDLDSEQHLFFACLKQIIALKDLAKDKNFENAKEKVLAAISHLDKSNESEEYLKAYQSMRVLVGLEAWLLHERLEDVEKAQFYKDYGLQAIGDLARQLSGDADSTSNPGLLKIYEEGIIQLDTISQILADRYVRESINDFQMSQIFVDWARDLNWRLAEDVTKDGLWTAVVQLVITDFILAGGLQNNQLEEDDPLIDQVMNYARSLSRKAQELYEVENDSYTPIFLNLLLAGQQSLPDLILQERKYFSKSEVQAFHASILNPFLNQTAEYLTRKYNFETPELKREVLLESNVDKRLDALVTWQLQEITKSITELQIDIDFFQDIEDNSLFEALHEILDEQIAFIDGDTTEVYSLLLMEKAILHSTYGEYLESAAVFRRLGQLVESDKTVFGIMEANAYRLAEDFEKMGEVIEATALTKNDAVASNTFLFPYALSLLGRGQVTEAIGALDTFINFFENRPNVFPDYNSHYKLNFFSDRLKSQFNFGINGSTNLFYAPTATANGSFEASLSWSGGGDSIRTQQFANASKQIFFRRSFSYGSVSPNIETIYYALLVKLFLNALDENQSQTEVSAEQLLALLSKNLHLVNRDHFSALAWVTTFIDLKGHNEVAGSIVKVIEDYLRYANGDALVELIEESEINYPPVCLSYLKGIERLGDNMPRWVELTFNLDFIKPEIDEQVVFRGTADILQRSELNNYQLEKAFALYRRMPTQTVTEFADRLIANSRGEDERYYRQLFSSQSFSLNELTAQIERLTAEGLFGKAFNLVKVHGKPDQLADLIRSLPKRKWSSYNIKYFEDLLLSFLFAENGEVETLPLAFEIENKIDEIYLAQECENLADMLCFVYLQNESYDRLTQLAGNIANFRNEAQLETTFGAVAMSSRFLAESSRLNRRAFTELKEDFKAIRTLAIQDGEVGAFIDETINSSYSSWDGRSFIEHNNKFLNDFTAKRMTRATLSRIYEKLWSGQRKEAAEIYTGFNQYVVERNFYHEFIGNLVDIQARISSDLRGNVKAMEEYREYLQNEKFEDPPELLPLKQLLINYYNEKNVEEYHRTFQLYESKFVPRVKSRNADYHLFKGFDLAIERSVMEEKIDSIFYYFDQAYRIEDRMQGNGENAISYARANAINQMEWVCNQTGETAKGIETLQNLTNLGAEGAIKSSLYKVLSRLYGQVENNEQYFRSLNDLFKFAQSYQDQEGQLWAVENMLRYYESQAFNSARIADSLSYYKREALSYGHWKLLFDLTILEIESSTNWTQRAKVLELFDQLDQILTYKLDPREDRKSFLDLALLKIRYFIQNKEYEEVLELMEGFFEHYRYVDLETDAQNYARELRIALTTVEASEEFYADLSELVVKKTDDILFNRHPHAAIEMLILSYQLEKNEKTYHNLEIAKFLAEFYNNSNFIRVIENLIDSYLLEGKQDLVEKLMQEELGKFREFDPFVYEGLKQRELAIPDKQLQSIWQKGRLAVYERDFEKAEEFFAEAYRLDPNNALIQLQLGEVRGVLGDYQTAIDLFKGLLEKESEDVERAYLLNQISSWYLGQKECELALQYSDQAIGNMDGTEHFKGIYQNAANLFNECFINVEDYDLAKRSLDNLNLLDSSNVLLQYFYGQNEFEHKNYREAIDFYTSFYTRQQEGEDNLRADVLLKIGYAHMQLSGFDEAIDYLQQSLVIDSANYYGWYYLAEAQRQKQDFRSAADYYLQARAYSTADGESFLIYQIDRMADQATDVYDEIYIYKRLTTEFPSEPNYWVDLADAYRRLGENEERVQALLRAIGEGPDDAWLWVTLGNAQMDNDDPENALVSYQRGLELNPSNKYAWYQIGSIFLNRRQFSVALNNFDKALDIDPAYAPALGNKSRCDYRMKNFTAAEVSIDQALAIDTSNAGLWHHKGLVDHSLGKNRAENLAYINAELVQAEICKANPGSASAFGNLAWYQLFTQKFEDAAISALRGIEIDSEEVFIYTNLLHARLFSDDTVDGARTIYEEQADRTIGGKSFRLVILEDFEMFKNSSLNDNPKVRRSIRAFTNYLNK